MTLWKTGICAIWAVLLLYPAAAMAESDSPPGRWWQMPAIAEKLDLSAQEQKSLEGLYTQKRKVLFEMRSEVEKQRLELDSLLEKEPIDQRAVSKQFRKLEESRQRLSGERFQYLLEVRRIIGRDRYLMLMSMAKERSPRRNRFQHDDLTPR